MDMDRRSFLKILSATLAVPIIAKAALTPQLIIPGIVRVTEYSGAGEYANAIFTPGQLAYAADVLQTNIVHHIPYGTDYTIVAVPMTTDSMVAATRNRYRRPGYACMWMTTERSFLDDSCIWIGDFKTGVVTHNYVYSPRSAAEYFD